MCHQRFAVFESRSFVLTREFRVEVQVSREDIQIQNAVFCSHVFTEVDTKPHGLSVGKGSRRLTTRTDARLYLIGSKGIVHSFFKDAKRLIVVECFLATDDIAQVFNSVQTTVRMGNSRIVNQTYLKKNGSSKGTRSNADNDYQRCPQVHRVRRRSELFLSFVK